MEEPTITVFIGAHGNQSLHHYLGDREDHVELLSICGKIGGSGLTSLGLEDARLETLLTHYQTQKNNYSLFKTADKPLEQVYTEYNCTFENGFQYTYPKYERTWFFEEHAHDDCRRCPTPLGRTDEEIEQEPDPSLKFGLQLIKSKRCMPQRNPAKIPRLNIGLTIVSSTLKRDNKFTLQTLSRDQNVSAANLSQNKPMQSYWEKYLDTGLLSDFIETKQINLKNLVKLFLNDKSGFTRLLIIDAACRSIVCSQEQKDRVTLNESYGLETPRYIIDDRMQRLNIRREPPPDDFICQIVNGVRQCFRNWGFGGKTRRRKNKKTQYRKNKKTRKHKSRKSRKNNK